MEETVGRWWHGALMRLTAQPHPEATVSLDEVRPLLLLMFRAAGGGASVRLAPAGLQRTARTGTWLHRVAGTGDRHALAIREPDVLALPPSLNVFDRADWNRDLYQWLALMSAHWPATGHWVHDNVFATQSALSAFPGFEVRYQNLCNEHLRQRCQADSQPLSDAERTVRAALQGEPWSSTADVQPRDVAPVWLWLCGGAAMSPAAARAGGAATPAEPGACVATDTQRRRVRATEHTVARNPLVLPFRAEALMSWTEMVRVNRATDDQDDGNALQAANDMEQLSVSTGGQTLASRVKFDLDLPSAAADDVPVGEGMPLPEWDHRRGRLLPDHVRAQVLLPRVAEGFTPPPGLRVVARQVRRRMEVLRHAPRLQRGQEQGDDIDLDAWIRLQADGQGQPGGRSATPPVYARRVRGERSLATWLLADLSQSTDAHVNDHLRVIDVIRDALHVFGEALHAVGDPFAIWGFSSVRRQHVRLHPLKDMAERWGPLPQARVAAIRPGYYTRMGAAIRHATRQLQQCPQRARLLMLLTDGKPNDLDAYEGRYGLEDTRHAIQEAREAGLVPFCVTIDADGHDYLPYLFGAQGYVLVHQPQDLGRRLTQAWTLLARQGG